MQVAKVPRPVFRLSYEQKDISSDVTPYVRSVTYTDYLQGQSDELEVELEDADGRWIGAWYPGMGDKLTLRIGYDGEPLLPCGSFEIDEIGFGGAPSIVTIRGLSTGVTVPVRTKEHKPYENTTPKASLVFSKSGLTCDPERLALHRLATEYREACPALSYTEAVALANGVLTF